MLRECVAGEETYGTPTGQDWDTFLAWARREGWRVPPRELALYRNDLADSAFVLRNADRAPVGFVTVCRHLRSAWIGNLIIDPARRGQGCGRRLFAHALGMLATRGVATLWLTASAGGRRLYASCGFREAGRVERWVWQGDPPGFPKVAAAANGDLLALTRADAAAWGDSRVGLLTLLARGGQVVSSGSSIALVQPAATLNVLGPWLSADLCPRANRIVLSRILEAVGGRGELAVDVLGDSPLRLLLQAAGFRQSGETVLMVRGESGQVQLGQVVALASLGSMG
jgi:GNAT superfamily N-acetyltransferase